MLLYFVFENCVFYVTMKKKISGKVTQALLSLKLYWNLKQYGNNNVFTYIFCLLVAHCFICVVCFISKHSFKFNFSKTNAQIRLTEYVVSIYFIKCIICAVR